MSHPGSLATVTATMRDMLAEHTSAISDHVTSLPPGKVDLDDTGTGHLNIYLYGTAINTAFSNTPFPDQTKDDESRYAPLPLILKYLVSAYGNETGDPSGHLLMGEAMRVFHDHSILGKSDLEGHVTDSDLHNQIEKVRITADPISLDDMSKLWTSFQAEYQLSAGYEVSVVFIDSKRPSKTPLPVLKRGRNSDGVQSQANLIPPIPTLSRFIVPDGQPGIEPGSELLIEGHHLEGANIALHLYHPHLEGSLELPVEPDAANDEHITITLPDDNDTLRAGIQQVEARITINNEDGTQTVKTTNQLALPVAPRITIDGTVRDGVNLNLTLTCNPRVHPDQKTFLLFSDRQIPYQSSETEPHEQLEFTIEDVASGTYYIRLRVDGVDSFLVPDRTAQPPEYDSNARVLVS